jgi:glycerophosphoryl diester phosphodiesterase
LPFQRTPGKMPAGDGSGSVPKRESIRIVTFQIIAHRGANREAPENTIPAFKRALEIGVHGIELDVHVTRDNVPVVHHDAVLPDGGRIERMDSTDLERRTDAPTLAEVLELVNGRCHVYVEIKATHAMAPSVELLKDRTAWCSLHSFDHRLALMSRVLCPALNTGVLLVSRLVDPRHAFRSANATDVWQHADYIDPDLIGDAHGEGARVIAWTVNDVRRARELQALGVDGICTDAPRELLAGLSGTAP